MVNRDRWRDKGEALFTRLYRMQEKWVAETSGVPALISPAVWKLIAD